MKQLGFDSQSVEVIVSRIFNLFSTRSYLGLKIEGLTVGGYRSLTEYLWDLGLLDNSVDNWYFDGNYSFNDELGLKQKSFFEKNKITIPEIKKMVNAIEFDNPEKYIFLISHAEDVLFNYERVPNKFIINVSGFKFTENYWIIQMFKRFNFTVEVGGLPNTITLKIP